MFSVVLPVVKTRFLAEAIDGILAQTHRDFELIVVDNAADGDVRALVGEDAVGLEVGGVGRAEAEDAAVVAG